MITTGNYKLTGSFLCLLVLLAATGCYTFKGYSISPEIETFFVEQFENKAFNAPPNINQTFSESFKLKINRESRLVLDSRNPDILFSGAITRYTVTSVSPEPGETTALQRLDVTVEVEYTNTRDLEDQWKQSFSFFADFLPDQNLLDVQDQLIETIFIQIQEDIFNKAFANW